VNVLAQRLVISASRYTAQRRTARATELVITGQESARAMPLTLGEHAPIRTVRWDALAMDIATGIQAHANASMAGACPTALNVSASRTAQAVAPVTC